MYISKHAYAISSYLLILLKKAPIYIIYHALYRGNYVSEFKMNIINLICIHAKFTLERSKRGHTQYFVIYVLLNCKVNFFTLEILRNVRILLEASVKYMFVLAIVLLLCSRRSARNP